eukprot:gene22295-30536_t
MDPELKKEMDYQNVGTTSPMSYTFEAPQHTPVYGQQVTAINQQPTAIAQAHIQHPAAYQQQRNRPLNRWGDSICDWLTNLYPSCYLSQKTGFVSFRAALGAYSIIFFISIIIQLAAGAGGIILWLPILFAFFFHIALRLHIVRQEDIRDCGAPPCSLVGEFCCGFWCWYCSVAQMARHTYGYTKVLDGDGDPDRLDGYTPVQV